ncbi:PepSY domain-containing protein [Paracoccus sp. PAR01]|uniref:PepSY domain-containing protein n=1 Tax=Paracoccus sp. PAR01 TaxID=2769282 RepID=UPI001780BE2A|nr:PepSY domain-containing protein [Paracoccus sp. PAR01]MBD9527069.1 PepSY domain-containing protein [Paracoccus sp. PAR01]
MRHLATGAALAAAIASNLAIAAHAGPEMSDAEEVQAVQQSGMTLNQAIDKAVAQTGGTAISAGWEDNEAGVWGYEVEIADASKAVQNWFVNPKDGSITQLAEENDDHHEKGAADKD